MKDKDRMFQLSSDLIALQKESNALKEERDSLARRVRELEELVSWQEEILNRAEQFYPKPSKKPKAKCLKKGDINATLDTVQAFSPFASESHVSKP